MSIDLGLEHIYRSNMTFSVTAVLVTASDENCVKAKLMRNKSWHYNVRGRTLNLEMMVMGAMNGSGTA